MKTLGVLFILILFLGVSIPDRAQAIQVNCPFPGHIVWQEDKYVCHKADQAPAPAVQTAPVVVQQYPPIVVPSAYPYPYYPYAYPYWGGVPYWGPGFGVYYGGFPGWYGGYGGYGYWGMNIRFGGHHPGHRFGGGHR